jgi:hypothetical protein
MMRKLIVSTVIGAALAFAPSAFPIAITNPSNGDCHEAVTPATFNGSSSAFPDNPGGAVGPWDGVFMSNGNSAAITGVFCP